RPMIPTSTVFRTDPTPALFSKRKIRTKKLLSTPSISNSSFRERSAVARRAIPLLR
ncbi:hypothetical protein HAX54_040624, partial [Datura stramonium]|nr:hypothetical protein [Datura stramonium]